MFAAAISKAVFKLCHGKNLVYNTCWEDPRLDRVALELGPGDRLLMITSAGCNALDYALDEPERIDTVDVNPRQNALLELKQVAIRQLDYEAFFQLFGRGRLANWREIYQSKIQSELSPAARKFWDKKHRFFNGKGRRPSFYFRGSSGFFAWSINGYVNRVAKIRPQVDRLLAATSLDEQREVYENQIKPVFWGPGIQWFLKRDSTLSLLGVPRAQRTQLERYYPGGITQFIEDRLDWLFTKVPIHDNYFWRVYMTGEYTPDCCPDYLKEENFHRLKGGLVDRVHTHTTTLLDHLKSTRRNYSHYVLLDHMDWLAEHHHDILEQQWQAIVDHADPEARILWRSAALKVEFVDPIAIRVDGQQHPLGDLLEYNEELASELNTRDRVNTYASFAITTLHKPNEAALAAHHDERTGTTQDPLPSGPVAHSG